MSECVHLCVELSTATVDLRGGVIPGIGDTNHVARRVVSIRRPIAERIDGRLDSSSDVMNSRRPVPARVLDCDGLPGGIVGWGRPIAELIDGRLPPSGGVINHRGTVRERIDGGDGAAGFVMDTRAAVAQRIDG